MEHEFGRLAQLPLRGPDPEIDPKAPPLERDRELAELEAAVAEVASGRGRLVVIEAHAGLGKTRLLEAARTAASCAGVDVLSACGTELERDFPFALVRQLFEPRLRALAAPERERLFEGASAAARGALGFAAEHATPEPSGDPAAVLYGLYWLTAALTERRPLLLTLDDAHWADVGSLDFVSFLLPRLVELPVLLAVAARPGEAADDARMTRIATDPAGRRLAPAALSAAATRALLAAQLVTEPEAAFTIACHEVTGGNPFLLHELAGTLAAQAIEPRAANAGRVRELTPERVARSVTRRVARLSADARAVAGALAVLGEDSDHRLVATLAGVDPDAALEAADALRAHAILDSGASLRFVHPLVRTALYADLGVSERAGAHARAARLLDDCDADRERIALQLALAPPRGAPETVATLLEAARRALGRGAPQSAVAALTRALREPPTAGQRTEVLGLLLTACLRTADDAAFAAVEPALLAELDLRPELLGRWAGELASLLAIGGRIEEGVALLERAIDVTAREGDADRAVQLEAQLVYFTDLPPVPARRRLARYDGRLVPGSPGERLASALGAGWALADGSAAEGSELALRALADGAIFTEQPEQMSAALAVLALLAADELDAAARAVDEALARARRSGAVPALSSAWYLRGCVALARGDVTAGEADARQAIAAARLQGFLSGASPLPALLADILLEQGELDAAEAELEAAAAGGAVPDIVFSVPHLAARARLRLAQGRAREAAEELAGLQRRMERWGVDGTPLVQVRGHAARALVALGDHTDARELAEAELARAERWGSPSARAGALRALALAVGGADGLQLLEQAVALLAGSPRQLDRAHALGELGAGLRRANRRAAAREPLREALRLARACGAGALARRAYDELQASGERVRRWTPIGVASLTPSERRVAELAASGMTNRQIAQTLFLSVKTIEAHLSAAYDKLGIRTRQQLAGAFAASPDDR
jgi:DNA-binding CsgD family transcriptional regulator